jgi:glycosyltransferase involved in cell wall biosynthesis
MTTDPLRIAFVSVEDPASPDQFSGVTFQLVAALRRQGADVTTLGPTHYRPTRWQRWKQKLYRRFGRNFDPQQSTRGFTQVGHQFDERLQLSAANCVLGRATPSIAALQTELPVFLWHDATFRQLLSAYRGFVALPAESRRSCERFEHRAVGRCRGLFYTSRWAAQSAETFYGADAERVRVIPIGANRDSGWDDPAAARHIAEKTFSVCRLLFLGVDWHRKGGDRFLRLVARLSALGLPVEATIVGDWPPGWETHPGKRALPRPPTPLRSRREGAARPAVHGRAFSRAAVARRLLARRGGGGGELRAAGRLHARRRPPRDGA